MTGDGEEHGTEFEFSWCALPTDATFALDLDDYLSLLTETPDDPPQSEVAAD